MPMNWLRSLLALLLAVLALACGVRSLAADSPAASALKPEDYTLLWWAEGPPYYLGSATPPAHETLCFQSGGWGLALDTKRVRVLRAGMFPAMETMERATRPGDTELAALPPADWDCSVVSGGTNFTCFGHMETNDEVLQPVRFVESGRFFQRVVIEGLKFADTNGHEFPCAARLEISAWPDRLALRLELAPKGAAPAAGQIELRLGQKRARSVLSAPTNSVQLGVFGEGDVPRVIVETDPALKTRFDAVLGCETIALPDVPWSNAKGTYYPEEHLDRLDRWRVTLRNDSDRETTARLMFTQENNIPITGFTPMLCDADGTPSGLPVQISKNWHRRPEKGDMPHEGPWFHGCALVRLPPKSKRDLLFQMVYARYGGVFAVSHSQLCLVGWGHNQFWEEAALGSFGESICFEPGRVQRRCFMDDIRPFLTLPDEPNPKPWGWAGNCGGGDFLMWQDDQGRYQPMCATRTDFRAYGPCLTDVVHTEESAGGEIAARMGTSLARSDDHLRVFLHLRYDVRARMHWRRLAFLQYGADFYNDTPSRLVAVGDTSGLREEWEPKGNDGVFDKAGVALSGPQPWVSMHGFDRSASQPGRAAASRGLVVRSWSAVLGGKPSPQPHVTFFRTEWGRGNRRTVVELAPPPEIKELLPGDFVEAQVELLVFPADAPSYYGPDESFKKVLARDADTWRPVQREGVGNALNVRARRGAVANSYPLLVNVDGHQSAEVAWKGGLGYLPATFIGLTKPKGYHLTLDGKLVDQSAHGNDFWQTDFDAESRQWRMTFNIHPDNGPARAHTLIFTPDTPRQN